MRIEYIRLVKNERKVIGNLLCRYCPEPSSSIRVSPRLVLVSDSAGFSHFVSRTPHSLLAFALACLSVAVYILSRCSFLPVPLGVWILRRHQQGVGLLHRAGAAGDEGGSGEIGASQEGAPTQVPLQGGRRDHERKGRNKLT